MPTLRFGAPDATVAIGGVIQNLMTGSQFEFLARATRVQIYGSQDPLDLGTMEVFFGQELEMAVSPIPFSLNAGEGPLVPNDLLLDDFGAPGDRIVIRLTETGGAATAVTRVLVVLTPA